MSLKLADKEQVVAALQAKLANVQAMAVAEYRGLSVAQMTALRVAARKQSVHVQVVKNTLLKRALADTDFAVMNPLLSGPLVFAASEDPVAVAKVLTDFAKGNDKLVITGGALGAKLMDAKALQQLSKMPSREELLAKLMGTMQAPISTFVRTLNEVPGRFVRTLAAVRDQAA
ncbi:50S ribosomal protein L10 [Acidithiobacillus sp. CV18-2]|uniref:Large ribosomal subunit protein uL10 n=1 Tax=Igneacidithiobacillus copahuensis TaxID=2724909 RepID=A0AAE2YPQ9_9PROT|nr:50S ribosomal protein L10 [Acidithiobacillus sp. CV18-3]MBU2758177.1 50S ribosomal protein L10 [Acidithiobacillus sp. BN09-2]MBU2777522.1 50S ribosomal protein L10 [Acidithiobacillus sp. CV18-2]MBU2787688.1 50S ribosomal protein L10 [Igneacidithiobacillus copahuensis]MBU2795365.1 50S ribosomal protein L10 [Acidithiobacillus sp. VAN18-2]MBU2799987.1 50S ribosomal protein L10 [Acidithiobacillus sp. VAN18-4]UTV81383.1 50S ribosomal protein L10 [Acidithiobacillus sp. YTS05]